MPRISAPQKLTIESIATPVGGWLAQGGGGLGSHAYGWFADNVIAAGVVRSCSVGATLAGTATISHRAVIEQEEPAAAVA